MLEKDVPGRLQEITAAPRYRVVEADHQVTVGCCPDPTDDVLPGSEEVGKGNRAEIMTEHGTGLC